MYLNMNYNVVLCKTLDLLVCLKDYVNENNDFKYFYLRTQS